MCNITIEIREKRDCVPLDFMQPLFIVWIGTGLCGYGGGDIFSDYETAFDTLPEEDRKNWNYRLHESMRKNVCDEPYSYIEIIHVSQSALYAIANGKKFIK